MSRGDKYLAFREPGFLIIGGQRCGTTYLYRELTSHPYIRPAAKKEIHFFDDHYPKGIDWYRSHFPPSGMFPGVISGEASPYYFFHPAAPRRVYDYYPAIKLILLLRNPVDRAYSHYYHNIRRNRETRSFAEAIAMEPRLIAGDEERLYRDDSYRNHNHKHFSYLARGVYIRQLERWTALFPMAQFKIIKSEHFFNRPQEVLEEIVAFLGIESSSLKKSTAGDIAVGGGANYPTMSSQLRLKLQAYFQPHNRRLYQFLGTHLGWEEA
jgi:hypothetical protein